MSRILPQDVSPPIDATQMVHPIQQRLYDQYWTTISIGAIMKTLSYAANIEIIGPVSISDPTAQLQELSPLCWAPADYTTQISLERYVRYDECVVELPHFGGGTVTRSFPQEFFEFDLRGTLSYEELYRRCQEASNTEAQLRCIILSETVLKDSIPTQAISHSRSVSRD